MHFKSGEDFLETTISTYFLLTGNNCLLSNILDIRLEYKLFLCYTSLNFGQKPENANICILNRNCIKLLYWDIVSTTLTERGYLDGGNPAVHNNMPT